MEWRPTYQGVLRGSLHYPLAEVCPGNITGAGLMPRRIADFGLQNGSALVSPDQFDLI